MQVCLNQKFKAGCSVLFYFFYFFHSDQILNGVDQINTAFSNNQAVHGQDSVTVTLRQLPYHRKWHQSQRLLTHRKNEAATNNTGCR